MTTWGYRVGQRPTSVCPNGGLPLGGDVNVAMIIQAVNNALNGCGGFCEGTCGP